MSPLITAVGLRLRVSLPSSHGVTRREPKPGMTRQSFQHPGCAVQWRIEARFSAPSFGKTPVGPIAQLLLGGKSAVAPSLDSLTARLGRPWISPSELDPHLCVRVRSRAIAGGKCSSRIEPGGGYCGALVVGHHTRHEQQRTASLKVRTRFRYIPNGQPPQEYCQHGA